MSWRNHALGAQTITLTEVLPAIRQLSVIEKLKLIRILAEDLEAAEDISPLVPFKTYDLPTPYNMRIMVSATL